MSSITRINHFVAAQGSEDALRAFLAGIIGEVREAPGCVSVQLLVSAESAARYAILEIWESVEAHHAAAACIPAERIAQVLPLLAAPPSGEYFRVCES